MLRQSLLCCFAHLLMWVIGCDLREECVVDKLEHRGLAYEPRFVGFGEAGEQTRILDCRHILLLLGDL